MGFARTTVEKAPRPKFRITSNLPSRMDPFEDSSASAPGVKMGPERSVSADDDCRREEPLPGVVGWTLDDIPGSLSSVGRRDGGSLAHLEDWDSVGLASGDSFSEVWRPRAVGTVGAYDV